jgi:hypothetical protein
MPQTTIQISRCLTLGTYTARVEGDELRIRGLQPLAGPLPASIKANSDELIAFLNEWADGVWPRRQGRDSGRHSRSWAAALALRWMPSRRR